MIKFYSGKYNLIQLAILKNAIVEAKMYICDYAEFNCNKCRNKHTCNDLSRFIDYLEVEITRLALVKNSVEKIDC